MGHKQPAQPSYFFHGGFVDLGRVIGNTFRDCGDVIVRSAEGIAESWSDLVERIGDHGVFSCFTGTPCMFMIGFYLMRLIFSTIFTPIICFSITVFQIVLLIVFFAFTMVFFGLITLTDRIYCLARAIVSHCPSCQDKFIMPVYICPRCGVEHDRLRPGYYGLFRRKCNCGELLPTTFMNGRQKLEARCPHCKHVIKDGGLHSSWCFPVVGGPSSGKTCYISMVMMSLEKNAQSKYGLQFEYEKNALDEYEQNAANLSNGNPPDKTPVDRLRYYQFTLTPKGAMKQQIALCDVAGEIFDISVGGNTINTQMGLRFVNAFMLIVDPLSIADYRNEVSQTVNLNGYSGSAQPIDEMLDTFARTLQNMFSVSPKAMLDTDVAVVFTKADIPGLDEKIGQSALLKNAPNLSQKVRYETQNKLCEQFLRDYNEENFLNSLKRFRNVQFFACSALGHVRDGQPFTASNVEEPFFWLVGKRSRVIDSAAKTVK